MIRIPDILDWYVSSIPPFVEYQNLFDIHFLAMLFEKLNSAYEPAHEGFLPSPVARNATHLLTSPSPFWGAHSRDGIVAMAPNRGCPQRSDVETHESVEVVGCVLDNRIFLALLCGVVCAYGGIGIRTGFKIQRPFWVCGFDPR